MKRTTARHALIVGCGYVGTALARELTALGERVTGWVRSAENATALRAEGLATLVGDVARTSDWASVPGDVDAVVHCASSNRRGAAVYAEVYREGLRHIVRRFPKARIVFVSSTSVYAQTRGEWVTEQSPAEPSTETGQILREAEQLGLDHGAMVLRLAGIYGPGRQVLIERLRQGEAMIEGDGMRWINQIHRDDAARAIVTLLNNGNAGEIYNGSDGAPVTQYDYYRLACERLRLTLPPFGPINAARKRGLTNKRVSNEKLHALGWSPEYSSFVDAITF